MPRIKLLPEVRRWAYLGLEVGGVGRKQPGLSSVSSLCQSYLHGCTGFTEEEEPLLHPLPLPPLPPLPPSEGMWQALEQQWLACIVLLQRRYLLICDIKMGNSRAKWLRREKHFPPSPMR